MKAQGVKKWIKGFFVPKSQPQPQHTTTIEVVPSQSKNTQQTWTEAEAEIINHLINMDSLIKISKHLNEQQYAALSQINLVLCQQNIDINDARKSLIGGLQAVTQEHNLKYITKHLPYQYYSVRSLLWKIEIGYLSERQKQKWISWMEKNLYAYRQFVFEFLVQPIQKKMGLGGAIQTKKVLSSQEKVKDHPLSSSQESRWGSYFKDVELWTLIEKDTKRTRKNCKFFQELNPVELENDEVLLKSEQISFTEKKQQTYADSLTRIIFIYLKNHPHQNYYQGMNELAALIYYCFTNKNSQYFRRVSQSDAYFTFQKIIARLPKKHFQKGDQYVKDFINVLKKVDLRLYEQIQKNKGEDLLKMVTMKWFLSGFLSEFAIDDCLIIWDNFIAWPVENVNLIDCFMYMALSLVHLNRQKIMDGQNIALIFSKIANSVTDITQKTQNLYKIFPKLLQK